MTGKFANRVATVQCIKSCRYGSVASVNVHINHQKGKIMWSQWFWPWHNCWCQTGWFEYFCKLLMIWVFHEKQSRAKQNIQWVAVLWMDKPCWWERSMENGQTGQSWQKVYGNSNNHSAQLWWAEKQLRRHNTSNLEADGLQQEKTMSGSTSDSQEQKAEAAVGTGSPKLD